MKNNSKNQQFEELQAGNSVQTERMKRTLIVIIALAICLFNLIIFLIE